MIVRILQAKASGMSWIQKNVFPFAGRTEMTDYRLMKITVFLVLMTAWLFGSDARGQQVERILVSFQPNLLLEEPLVDGGNIVLKTSGGDKSVSQFTNIVQIKPLIPRNWKAYKIEGPYYCEVYDVTDIESYLVPIRKHLTT